MVKIIIDGSEYSDSTVAYPNNKGSDALYDAIRKKSVKELQNIFDTVEAKKTLSVDQNCAWKAYIELLQQELGRGLLSDINRDFEKDTGSSFKDVSDYFLATSLANYLKFFGHSDNLKNKERLDYVVGSYVVLHNACCDKKLYKNAIISKSFINKILQDVVDDKDGVINNLSTAIDECNANPKDESKQRNLCAVVNTMMYKYVALGIALNNELVTQDQYNNFISALFCGAQRENLVNKLLSTGDRIGEEFFANREHGVFDSRHAIAASISLFGSLMKRQVDINKLKDCKNISVIYTMRYTWLRNDAWVNGVDNVLGLNVDNNKYSKIFDIYSLSECQKNLTADFAKRKLNSADNNLDADVLDKDDVGVNEAKAVVPVSNSKSILRNDDGKISAPRVVMFCVVLCTGIGALFVLAYFAWRDINANVPTKTSKETKAITEGTSAEPKCRAVLDGASFSRLVSGGRQPQKA